MVVDTIVGNIVENKSYNNNNPNITGRVSEVHPEYLLDNTETFLQYCCFVIVPLLV